MAQGVNDMVAGHIQVKKKAMACVAEFGKGNFKAPLEQFPGKKAFINETIEQMRIQPDHAHLRHGSERRGAGASLRGTDRGEPSDGQQRGGNGRAGQSRFGGERAGFEERLVGIHGSRTDAGFDSRDFRERQRFGQGGQERRQRGRVRPTRP